MPISGQLGLLCRGETAVTRPVDSSHIAATGTTETLVVAAAADAAATTVHWPPDLRLVTPVAARPRGPRHREEQVLICVVDVQLRNPSRSVLVIAQLTWQVVADRPARSRYLART